MQVRVYATLRDLIGQSRLSVETTGASTVGDVLEVIASTYPVLDAKLWDVDRNLSGFVTVLLNGRSIDYLQGAKTPVTDADVISLFPPVGGGVGHVAQNAER